MRPVGRSPEIGQEHILLRVTGLGIDFLHDLDGQLLNWLARGGVMPIIFRTKPLRALHSLRLSVYNLGDVIAHMKSVESFEDVSLLVSCHSAFPNRNVSNYAMTMQWYEGAGKLSL